MASCPCSDSPSSAPASRQPAFGLIRAIYMPSEAQESIRAYEQEGQYVPVHMQCRDRDHCYSCDHFGTSNCVWAQEPCPMLQFKKKI